MGERLLGYRYFTRRRASGRAPAVGASQLTRSRARVRRTRQPSRKVFRFELPEIRYNSWLGYLGDPQARPGGAHDQFGLDLEAVGLQFEDLNAFAAEGDVAVAKVGEIAVQDERWPGGQACGSRYCATGDVVGPPPVT